MVLEIGGAVIPPPSKVGFGLVGCASLALPISKAQSYITATFQLFCVAFAFDVDESIAFLLQLATETTGSMFNINRI